MSLITIEQFEELVEDYPDLAQCYDLNLIYATVADCKSMLFKILDSLNDD